MKSSDPKRLLEKMRDDYHWCDDYLNQSRGKLWDEFEKSSTYSVAAGLVVLHFDPRRVRAGLPEVRQVLPVARRVFRKPTEVQRLVTAAQRCFVIGRRRFKLLLQSRCQLGLELLPFHEGAPVQVASLDLGRRTQLTLAQRVDAVRDLFPRAPLQLVDGHVLLSGEQNLTPLVDLANESLSFLHAVVTLPLPFQVLHLQEVHTGGDWLLRNDRILKNVCQSRQIFKFMLTHV